MIATGTEHVSTVSTTVSVVIITLNRPDCLRRCLKCLYAQDPPPNQIVVADASSDDTTRYVVNDFQDVVYIHNPHGMATQTISRNMALQQVRGQIIAFLDDDAFPRPGWLHALIEEYRDPTVGGVGGRVLNGQPDEATRGVDEIGLLKRNGQMTGNFAADPGSVIEVDHLMGANMSFRREAVGQVGGFRDGLYGISGIREESEISLCVKRLGYRLVFTPNAVVDHVGAPQAFGRRFDLRYAYCEQRNHLILLIRNYGIFAPIVGRYLWLSAGRNLINTWRRVVGGMVKCMLVMMGMVVGMAKGIMWRWRLGYDTCRDDRVGLRIKELLASRPK